LFFLLVFDNNNVNLSSIQVNQAAGSNSFVPVDKSGDSGEAGAAGKKETPTSIAAKFLKSSTANEKCDSCGKTVYATEKIVVEEKDGKKVFHKGCLRCTHCQVVLTLGNYASMNGITYCKPHFKQLFATKGNYDEGFGKEKLTSKWEPQITTAPATFVPVDKDEHVKNDKKADPVVNSPTSSKFGNVSDKCHACGKTVYLTEKIVVEDKEDKAVYHKACLRCSHCQVILTLGNYASLKGVMYCKPHFKQLFAAKGNYEEGFGKEKVTHKWDQSDSPVVEEEHRHEEEHRPHVAEPPHRHEEEHHHHHHEEEHHHHEGDGHHHHEEEHHHEVPHHHEEPPPPHHEEEHRHEEPEPEPHHHHEDPMEDEPPREHHHEEKHDHHHHEEEHDHHHHHDADMDETPSHESIHDRHAEDDE